LKKGAIEMNVYAFIGMSKKYSNCPNCGNEYIGKAKPSESKENLYYQIIDSRYRSRKPIIFSSNEDKASLAERIGYAAADRLLKGMAYDRCFAFEGPSQRGK
jgi:DNA replication protein DnaC